MVVIRFWCALTFVCCAQFETKNFAMFAETWQNFLACILRREHWHDPNLMWWFFSSYVDAKSAFVLTSTCNFILGCWRLFFPRSEVEGSLTLHQMHQLMNKKFYFRFFFAFSFFPLQDENLQWSADGLSKKRNAYLMQISITRRKVMSNSKLRVEPKLIKCRLHRHQFAVDLFSSGIDLEIYYFSHAYRNVVGVRCCVNDIHHFWVARCHVQKLLLRAFEGNQKPIEKRNRQISTQTTSAAMAIVSSFH